jgi:hypothetical protein
MTKLPAEQKVGTMLAVIRRIGIAIGSITIAYLALSLVASVVLGRSAQADPFPIGLVAVILGGLVYADIVRRERRTSPADAPPGA